MAAHHMWVSRASRAFQVHQMRDRCDAADAEATLQRSIASTAKAATRDRNCRGRVIYLSILEVAYFYDIFIY